MTDSSPMRRKAVEQWAVTVVAARDVTEHVRRITVASPKFAEYERAGSDEYFGLLVPRDGERPALRWYTMRAVRPEVCEMDVDVVVHGDDGPGSAWAVRAVPGDTVDMRLGGAEYTQLPQAGEVHLVVADETSLPAVAALSDDLAQVTDPGVVVALAETPTVEHAGDLATTFHVEHLVRGGERPGTLLIPAVQALDVPRLDYAWICGESKMAATLRRHVINDRGLDRKRITFSGYWRYR